MSKLVNNWGGGGEVRAGAMYLGGWGARIYNEERGGWADDGGEVK